MQAKYLRFSRSFERQSSGCIKISPHTPVTAGGSDKPRHNNVPTKARKKKAAAS